jgi:hypothetical protein
MGHWFQSIVSGRVGAGVRAGVHVINDPTVSHWNSDMPRSGSETAVYPMTNFQWDTPMGRG